MLYNALSMGKKTPKTAPSLWDYVTLLEEDRATAKGNMHKNLVSSLFSANMAIIDKKVRGGELSPPSKGRPALY